MKTKITTKLLKSLAPQAIDATEQGGIHMLWKDPKWRRFKLLSACNVACLVGALAWAPMSHAAIMFQFDFSGNTAGVGFLDPVDGPARQTALQQAADDYGALFVDMAVITMGVTSIDDPNDSTLASAGSEIVGPAPGFGLGEVVRNKVLTGNDLNGPANDGSVNVNWGSGFEISANVADVGPNEFDFFSTMFHELNHALGFLSIPGEAGDDAFGDGNNGNPGTWSFFDSFIVDVEGNPIIDQNLLLKQAVWDAGKIGGASPAGGLFFNGPNAVAGNGGNPVGLFTPDAFDEGSSVSHLDDENPVLAGLLMLAATDAGPSARTLSDIERGIYQDIGYSVVPIPAALPLFLSALIGLGIMGYTHRRHRRGPCLQFALER